MYLGFKENLWLKEPSIYYLTAHLYVFAYLLLDCWSEEEEEIQETEYETEDVIVNFKINIILYYLMALAIAIQHYFREKICNLSFQTRSSASARGMSKRVINCLQISKNLIDAANIAALAALSTFWRPECTVGGDDGQQVTVHDPEVRDPLPLTIHHMPIAVTFAYFGEGNIVVLDPTYKEEAVMGGRMTAIVNSNGDVCAIQKAGGEGLMSSVTMQCLRIASVKATDITSKIKKAVLIWDVEAQPNRHAVLGSSESRPDLILTGHKENAEFALAMCPAEPYVLSGGKDKSVVLWSIQDHIFALGDSSSSPGASGSKQSTRRWQRGRRLARCCWCSCSTRARCCFPMWPSTAA
ncbi:hypothetical protein ACJX0J_010059, partial [Zea mays]